MSYINPNLQAQLTKQDLSITNDSFFQSTVSSIENLFGGDESEQSSDAKSYMEYPSNLFSSNHNSVMCFRAVQLAKASTAYYSQLRTSYLNEDNTPSDVADSNSADLQACIFLPVPVLSDKVSHDVGETAHDLTGQAIASGVNVLSTLQNSGLSAAGGTAVNESKQFFGSAIEHAKRGIVNAQAYQLLDKSNRVAVDVATASFKGTNYRELTVTYTFVPKNIGELKEVANICKSFYLLSHASSSRIENIESSNTLEDETLQTTNSLYVSLLAPPVWFIEELPNRSTKHRFFPTYKMGPANLKDVTLDRSPDELIHTFKDSGDPYKVNMILTFTEQLQLTQERILAQWNSRNSGEIVS
ncbi:baseplate tail-tube junction protein [Vibrio harveyi]|uniref:baseplate tail-tube junction protein n=1 Tax=Vibrio harveyi TaxID=669 RepID=UPI0006822D4F|nr:baseplate tail-tube junction protein [Vibrio harveyi]PNM43641.1 hypothetical protein AL469_027720 [Vibrio harveyi]